MNPSHSRGQQWLFQVVAILGLVFYQTVAQAETIAAEDASPIPEFTHSTQAEWLNSPPLNTAALQGQVTLIDVWTFGCWNCYRSFPWLIDLEKRLSDQPFGVIGVHSPEFNHEKDRNNVVEKAQEFGLHHPIMLDNDFSYWKALNNRFWPSFYLVDKKGRLRAKFYGETHSGDRNAKAIEAAIRQLLSE